MSADPALAGWLQLTLSPGFGADLFAFVRAGLPLIEAVRMLGEEARNSTVRSMMVDIEDGLRNGEWRNQWRRGRWLRVEAHLHVETGGCIVLG